MGVLRSCFEWLLTFCACRLTFQNHETPFAESARNTLHTRSPNTRRERKVFGLEENDDMTENNPVMEAKPNQFSTKRPRPPTPNQTNQALRTWRRPQDQGRSFAILNCLLLYCLSNKTVLAQVFYCT